MPMDAFRNSRPNAFFKNRIFKIEFWKNLENLNRSKQRSILLECVVKVPSKSRNSHSPNRVTKSGPFLGFRGASSLIIHERKKFKFFFYFFDDTNPSFVNHSLKTSKSYYFRNIPYLVVYHLKEIHYGVDKV